MWQHMGGNAWTSQGSEWASKHWTWLQSLGTRSGMCALLPKLCVLTVWGFLLLWLLLTVCTSAIVQGPAATAATVGPERPILVRAGVYSKLPYDARPLLT